MLYKDFSPTPLDNKGYMLDDRQNWIVVPVSRTRDTGAFEESNFETAVSILGGESDTLEIHRFGHWGPGWFEILLAHPSLKDQVDEIQASLDHYPLLDDEDFSNREYEEACETWENFTLADRVDYCKRSNVSIFAARHDDLNFVNDDHGLLLQYLTTP